MLVTILDILMTDLFEASVFNGTIKICFEMLDSGEFLLTSDQDQKYILNDVFRYFLIRNIRLCK